HIQWCILQALKLDKQDYPQDKQGPFKIHSWVSLCTYPAPLLPALHLFLLSVCLPWLKAYRPLPSARERRVLRPLPRPRDPRVPRRRHLHPHPSHRPPPLPPPLRSRTPPHPEPRSRHVRVAVRVRRRVPLDVGVRGVPVPQRQPLRASPGVPRTLARPRAPLLLPGPVWQLDADSFESAPASPALAHAPMLPLSPYGSLRRRLGQQVCSVLLNREV
ncbi:hypothetical protein B0H17DRAFT_1096169, partial [Mycena rosella]